jgi:hypothetical protein
MATVREILQANIETNGYESLLTSEEKSLVTKINDASKGSNFIEPTEEMVLKVVDLYSKGKNIKEIAWGVLRSDGKKLSFSQVKDIIDIRDSLIKPELDEKMTDVIELGEGDIEVIKNLPPIKK